VFSTQFAINTDKMTLKSTSDIRLTNVKTIMVPKVDHTIIRHTQMSTQGCKCQLKSMSITQYRYAINADNNDFEIYKR